MPLAADQQKELDEMLSPSGVQPLNTSDGDRLVQFPGPVRLQDVVFELMRRGNSFDEIATITQRPVDQVEKIARSEWMQKEFQTLAKSGDNDSVRNMLRMHAFDAVRAVGDILRNPTVTPKDRLAAVRLVLDFTLTTAKDADFGGKNKALGMSPDELRAEKERLEHELSRYESKPKTL